MKERLSPVVKDPSTLLKINTFNLSPHFPQRDLQPFVRVTVHWGKGNNESFGDYWTIALNWDIFQKAQDIALVHQSINGLMEIRWSGVLPQVLLKVGPVHLQIHSVFFPPILEYIIGMLSSWQNPPIGSQTCGVRVSIAEKSKWKLPELPLCRKTSKLKELSHSWSDCRS